MGFADGYLSCPLIIEMLKRLRLGAWRDMAYEKHVEGFIRKQWEAVRTRAESEVSASSVQGKSTSQFLNPAERRALWASILEFQHMAEGIWEGCVAWQVQEQKTASAPGPTLTLLDVLVLNYDAEAFDIVDAVKSGSGVCFAAGGCEEEERFRSLDRDSNRGRGAAPIEYSRSHWVSRSRRGRCSAVLALSGGGRCSSVGVAQDQHALAAAAEGMSTGSTASNWWAHEGKDEGESEDEDEDEDAAVDVLVGHTTWGDYAE